MTQRIPEQLLDQLSAFIDDELADDQSELLVRRLVREPELRDAAGRFALIGEVLREGRGPWLSRGLRGRIAAALEQAPQIDTSAVVRGRWARWAKPVTGVAVAAAVALVAILGLQQSGSDGDVQQQPLLASNEEPGVYTVPPESTQLQPAAPTRLTNYAVLHSEYSTVGRRTVLSGIIANEPGATETSLPAPVEPYEQPAEHGELEPR